MINAVYNNGGYPKGGMDYEKSRRFAQIIQGIPLRLDSFFVCLDDAPWLRVVETFSIIVDKFVRVRMRALQGMSFCYGSDVSRCFYFSLFAKVAGHITFLLNQLGFFSLPRAQKVLIKNVGIN